MNRLDHSSEVMKRRRSDLLRRSRVGSNNEEVSASKAQPGHLQSNNPSAQHGAWFNIFTSLVD